MICIIIFVWLWWLISCIFKSTLVYVYNLFVVGFSCVYVWMASSRNHLNHSIKGSTLEAYPWTETHQVENPIRKQYKILHYDGIIVVAGYTHKQQILRILVNCFSNLRMGSTIQFKIKKNGVESHFLLVGGFFFFLFSFWFIPFLYLILLAFLPTNILHLFN